MTGKGGRTPPAQAWPWLGIVKRRMPRRHGDAQVAACLFSFENLVEAGEWDAEAVRSTPSTQPANHLGRPRRVGSTAFASAPAHGRWLRISPLSHFSAYAAAGPRAHDAASVCHGPAGTTDSIDHAVLSGLAPTRIRCGFIPCSPRAQAVLTGRAPNFEAACRGRFAPRT